MAGKAKPTPTKKQKANQKKYEKLVNKGKIRIPHLATKHDIFSTIGALHPPTEWVFEYITLGGAWGAKKYPKNPKWNNHGGFTLIWGVKGWGFGEISFVMKGGRITKVTKEWIGGKVVAETEAMGLKFAKAALAAFADSLVLKD